MRGPGKALLSADDSCPASPAGLSGAQAAGGGLSRPSAEAHAATVQRAAERFIARLAVNRSASRPTMTASSRVAPRPAGPGPRPPECPWQCSGSRGVPGREVAETRLELVRFRDELGSPLRDEPCERLADLVVQGITPAAPEQARGSAKDILRLKESLLGLQITPAAVGRPPARGVHGSTARRSTIAPTRTALTRQWTPRLLPGQMSRRKASSWQDRRASQCRSCGTIRRAPASRRDPSRGTFTSSRSSRLESREPGPRD